MPVEAPVIRAVWFVFAIVPGNARPVERTGTFEQRTHQLCWDDQCKGCSSRGRRYRENAENASESDADVEDPNCGPHPCAGSRSGAASSTFELLPRCPPTGNVPPLAVELSDWGGHVFYGAGQVSGFSSVYADSLRIQTAIVLVLALGIGLYFWVDSGYPSLLKKLHTGASIKLSGALSFDAKLAVTPRMPVASRIGRTTVNWMWTNRIGMTFGLGFGAALADPASPASAAALLECGSEHGSRCDLGSPSWGLLQLRGSHRAETLPGRGQCEHDARHHDQLSDAEVVVLAMIFALFPPGIAFLRLAAPLVLLALVPWRTPKTPSAGEVSCNLAQAAGGLAPTATTLKQYLKNLVQLAATTISFMILAACWVRWSRRRFRPARGRGKLPQPAKRRAHVGTPPMLVVELKSCLTHPPAPVRRCRASATRSRPSACR